MSWIVPENKLDDKQVEFIEKFDELVRNKVWIKGFPGSGKSVLLAYAVKKIKSKPDTNLLIVVFTHSLINMYKAAFAEMGFNNVKIATYFNFNSHNRNYDYILCDEVQDLPVSIVEEMKKRTKHLIVAGDSSQSIYDKCPRTNEATITPNQLRNVLVPSEFELNIIHRLSASIINAVNRFLPNLNIFGAKRDPNRRDTQVRLGEAYNEEEEAKYIIREAKKAINTGDTACVLIPTHNKIKSFIQSVISTEGSQPFEYDDYNELNRKLQEENIPLQYVGNGHGNFNGSRKICVMTYHSSKGLDFDNVFIPYLNNSLYIGPNETLNKTLFMVAMTRSRKNLYLTYNGYEHRYLNNFASDCNKINIHDALTGVQQQNNGGSIFAGF